MRKKIRVLIVDDSAFMRKWLTEIISSDPDCEVLAAAEDGIEALKAVERLRPDVVTMDIELPEIDGITCIAYIMEEFPTPVIVVTGVSEFMGEESIKALEYGALGLIRKPIKLITRDMGDIKHETLEQIKLASMVDVTKLKKATRKRTVESGKRKAERPIPKSTSKVVVIASSSGGPRALSEVVPKLPADLPAGVLLVQHIPAEFIPPLADRLNDESALDVAVMKDGEPIRQGKVLVMPADYKCQIERIPAEGEIIRLIPAKSNHGQPLYWADRLMTSLAPFYGSDATGVILTGMGNDGTEGARAIKENGGYIIAEAESTSIVYGMPRSVAEAGLADKVVPLHEIANEIVRAVKK